jgi:hypothetical protein
MYKRLCCMMAIIVPLLSITAYSSAQETNSQTSIIVEKKLLGYKYTYQDKTIKKLSELESIMTDSPEALSQLGKAKGYFWPGLVMASVGGFMIGWPIGQAAAGAEDPKWELAAIGGGIGVVGIILGVVSDKYCKKAVDAYNASIEQSSDAKRLDIGLAFSQNGLNLLLKF